MKVHFEAPLEEYASHGFAIKELDGGRVEISIDGNEKEVAISCSLNMVVWGPRGNFMINSDEDYLLLKAPAPNKYTKPTSEDKRKFVTHGRWFLDIFYGIERNSTKIADKKPEETFDIRNKDQALIVRRKISNKNYQYRWPYELAVYPDGRMIVGIRKTLKSIFGF